MRDQLQVTFDSTVGCPVVRLAAAGFYEVVEYLSWHRVSVQYGCTGDEFVVRFPNMTAEAAQKLMDLWVREGGSTGPREEHVPAKEPEWTEVLVG